MRVTRELDRLVCILLRRLGEIDRVAVVGFGCFGFCLLEVLLGEEVLVGSVLLGAELARLLELARSSVGLDGVKRVATPGGAERSQSATRQPKFGGGAAKAALEAAHRIHSWR